MTENEGRDSEILVCVGGVESHHAAAVHFFSPIHFPLVFLTTSSNNIPLQISPYILLEANTFYLGTLHFVLSDVIQYILLRIVPHRAWPKNLEQISSDVAILGPHFAFRFSLSAVGMGEVCFSGGWKKSLGCVRTGIF